MQESFDQEGFCFFKQNSIKHIVLGALPNEKISAVFLGRQRREIYSKLDQVIKPHPERVQALCADVPSCGGCVFQSLAYTSQLEYKQAKIRALFPLEESVCQPILASPKRFAYRAKMDFSFSQNRAGQKFLGLVQAKGSGRVIMTQACHLAQGWMNQVLKRVQTYFQESLLRAYDRSGQGDLRSLTLREGVNTQEKMVILEVVAHPKSALKKESIEQFVELFKQMKMELSCYLRIVQMIPKVPTQIYEMHLGGPTHIHETLVIQNRVFTFKISPSAFFQPNPFVAELLFNKIIEIILPLKIKQVCDLFCGTGTITLCIAPFVERCVGVELNPYAVFDARQNAALNQITNVEFVQQDASEFIKGCCREFDLVIVDPPRAGLGAKACSMLKSIHPPYILYVSCNPVTQAQDVLLLKEVGYKVALIQPLDQFPHTNHVENIVLLSCF